MSFNNLEDKRDFPQFSKSSTEIETPEGTPNSPIVTSTTIKGYCHFQFEGIRPEKSEEGNDLPSEMENGMSSLQSSFTLKNRSSESSVSNSKTVTDGVSLSPHESELTTDCRSSIGILSSEFLDKTENQIPVQSFAFNAANSKSTNLPMCKNDDGVFKVPTIPVAKPDVSMQGIPLHLLMPKDSVSVMSTDVSVANESSFSWDQIFNNEGDEKGDAINSASQLDLEKPLDDEEFAKLNKDIDSFYQGQFSARSTSFGGSNDSSGSRSAYTRDERFSDFSKSQHRGYDSKSIVADLSKEENEKISLLSGPADFSRMIQEVGNLDDEEFICEGGADLIDQAEKENEEMNRFSIGEVSDQRSKVETSELSCGFSSFKTSENVSDVLSRSQYFMLNSSRLGFLDASYLKCNEEDNFLRPHLGLLLDKKEKTNDTFTKHASDKEERNLTYTLTSDEKAKSKKAETSSNSKPDFSKVSREELEEMIKMPSSKNDPSFYSALIAEIVKRLNSSAQVEHKGEDSLNVSSFSELLPSFLEATVNSPHDLSRKAKEVQDHHKTNATETLIKATKRSPSPSSMKLQSKIPIRLNPGHSASGKKNAPQSPTQTSPTGHTKGSKTASQKNSAHSLKTNSSHLKVPIKGQRFSSPIKNRTQKALQTVASTVVKRDIFEEKKENQCQNDKKTSIAQDSFRRPLKTKNLNEKAPIIKVTESTPSPTKSSRENSLPIQTDKPVMTWLSVAIGRSEEQVVILRNITDKTVEVNVIIRDSSEFKLGLTSSQKVTLEANENKEIAVVFSPSCYGLTQGKLVLKPKGFTGASGQPMKGVILLQGMGGAPNVKVEGLGELLGGKRSLNLGRTEGTDNIGLTFTLSNQGPAPAFFKLQAFRDLECRDEDSDEVIIIRPKHGVLKANQLTEISIHLNLSNSDIGLSRGLLLGTMALFYGPEVCRQVLIEARKLPGARRLSSAAALLCQDFTHSFNNEQEKLFQGKISAPDVMQFYEKTRKEIVHFHGRVHGENLFNSIAAEDTLNDTRINCTLNVTNTDVPRRNVKELTSAFHKSDKTYCFDEKTRKSPLRSGAVYLDSSMIMFPVTKVGEKGTSMIKFKNRTPQIHTFKVGPIKPPFGCRHEKVTVQPGSYASLPIFYCPQDTGHHEATVSFSGTLCNLKANLRGSTVM